MRKIFIFYVICCIANIIFQFFLAYTSLDFQEFNFGFPIIMIFIIIIYSPLCTFLASLYYIFNINKQILRIPILYSLFPFITSYIIKLISDIDILLRDKLIIYLFCYENLLIIVWFVFQHYHKRNN